MREQFEILYVKCVLKPVITRIKHFDQLENEVKQTQDDAIHKAYEAYITGNKSNVDIYKYFYQYYMTYVIEETVPTLNDY